MPDHEDSLGGETLDGEAKADRAEQSLGDQYTLGDTNVEDELFDDGMKIEDLSERYTEEGVLGKGGFGEVILATDNRLERKVAIKRIQGKAARSKTAVQRFLTEAKSIAALSHNNIVQIYDYGRATDGPFLIMECVQGGSLMDLCRKGPIDLDEAVNIFSQVCDGLAKAHAAGIIHRDIKPANILMTEDGIPKLTDFGLAKDDTANTGMTMEGAVIGTLDFMPPEQRQGAELTDHRSDLWSLAATFYQMLTGEPPRVIDLDLLPPAIRPALAKSLKSKKEDRFQSAMEMREAILQAHSGKMDMSRSLGEGECPQCATLNPPDRKFCRNTECAAALEVDCLGCETGMPMWEGVCGNCGAKQESLLVEFKETLQAKHDEAEVFLSELKFDDALKAASVIGKQNDLRLQQLAAWHEEFSARLESSRTSEHARLGELLREAHVHEKAYDYEAGLQTLTQVAPSLKETTVSGNEDTAHVLTERLTTKQSRLKELEGIVRERVGWKREIAGLLPFVVELLTLKPDLPEIQKLKGQLEKRDTQQTVASSQQILEDTGNKQAAILNKKFLKTGVLVASVLIISVVGFSIINSMLSRGGPPPDPANTSTDVGDTSDTALNTSNDEPVDFEFADLVKPFDPPPLEEIISLNEWADKPVLDAVELMRERQAGEQQLATPAEALALKNSSVANNNKIISAMGRLAQEDEVNFSAGWNRHTSGDIKSTNPLMISSTAEFDVAGLTNMGLFGFDWNFVPFASTDVVVSWQTSANGLYDKVVMRDDLRWSDGTVITAHDVAYSYQIIMTSSVPIPAVRSGTDQLKYVHAYDDHTVIFFHNESLATNVWNINFPVIPKHIYENTVPEDPTMAKSEAHVALDENPITGGAYQITKRVRGQEIVLKRRESYYIVDGKVVRRKPNFETIRFHIVENSSTALLALKKGDIEEMQLSPEQWQSQTNGEEFYKNNTKSYALEWVYYYFGWNNRSPFFRDARVRQAMSYAFNHQELLERHRFGLDEAAQGIFHKTSRWAPTTLPAPYTQDLDKAEDLLAAAGWEDSDNDGVLDNIVELDSDFDGKIDGKRRMRFEFTILVSNKQERIDICTLLQENLDQIGIRCNVKPVEFTTLQQLSRDHQFDAIFAGWGTGADPDTSENLWTTNAIDAGRNYGCYSSKIVDQLFEDGKRELDPEKRAAIYQKIHLQLWDDQPYTWLYFRNAYYGFNRSLRGYNYSARGPYNYGPGESTIFKPAGMR